MKNFSSPKYLHHLTPSSKSLQKECKSASSATFNLSKKISNPHALVNRIERIKRLLLRFTSHTVLGRLGEMLLQAELQAEGWGRAELASEKHQGDISAVHPKTGEIIRFEVKTAKRGALGRWQFCLNKKNKTASSHSDYLYLLAIDEYGGFYRYLVPSCFFAGISQLTISSHPSSYKGKLSAFRLRGESIDIYQANEVYQLGARL